MSSQLGPEPYYFTPTPLVPTPPSGMPRYGISTGFVSRTWSDAEHAFAVSKLVELAQGHPFAVRVDGPASDAKLGRDVDAFQANGLTPYIVLYGTTGPRAADNLGQTIASRFRGTTPRVVFTGPNEPDLNGWTPNALADFQVAVYNSVKAGDPDALCGFGGLWKGSPPSVANLTSYITAYCSRAKGFFDFAAFHGYDDPTIHASYDIWDWWFPGGAVPTAQTMSEIIKSYGINVPIYNDESGTQITDAQQDVHDVDRYKQAQSDRCQGSFIYSLLPDGAVPFQIINADHTVRAAYTALKNFMAAL